MDDAELERLAREVRSEGSAGARLHYAAALRRLGRESEAIDVLRPALDDVEVRRTLAELPAWATTQGNHALSRFVDVRPVVRAPAVRWRTDLRRIDNLLASEVAVVALTSERVSALDPRDGALRWTLPASYPKAWIAGEVLLLRDDSAVSVRAHELWTGERLWETAPGTVLLGVAAGNVIGSDGVNLFSRSFGEPREPPGAIRWSVPVSLERTYLTISNELLVMPEPEKLRSLTARATSTGEVLWSREGTVPRLSGDKVLVTRLIIPEPFVPRTLTELSTGHARLLLDARGDEIWLHGGDGFSTNDALSPELAICQKSTEHGTWWHAFDAATGRPLFELPGYQRSVALVRGAVYSERKPVDGSYALAAFDARGAQLWSLPPDAPGGFYAPTPVDRRLYAIEGGSVVCLE